MTTLLAEQRAKRALSLMVIALIMTAVAAVTLAIEARSARPDLASGPVVPGLAQTIATAEKITVESRDASYHIERVQHGEDRAWVMRDRGDYPVLASRLAQLTEGLQGLSYVRSMTSDPSKHERLGVGDPRQGGAGVLVQIENADKALLVNLILGVQPEGFYARRPGDNQTWAVKGDLPPLRDIAEWLNLKPETVEAERIARAEIAPAEGRAYVLARASPETQDFAFAEPAGLAPQSVASLFDAATRVTRLAPTDVQPAPSIQGDAAARVRVTTFDGVTLEAELIVSDAKTWVKLVARADDPSKEADALKINDRVAAWAFALTDADAQGLAPALASLLPSAPAQP